VAYSLPKDSVSDSTSDEILMAAYQAGSEAAFGELFDRHAGSVYGFLVRRLGDVALAEDLHQEAFLHVHRARKLYDPKRPFRAWLFAIVHNLLNDALRARRRSPLEERANELAIGEVALDGPADDTLDATTSKGSPEEALAARECARALSRALSALPADEATVLILARFEGLSYEDIGLVVGRSPTAAKQLAYRALKRVRAELVTAGHGETL
jgi:RNA polymerase sigma-70 factor (ECF subfamily)